MFTPLQPQGKFKNNRQRRIHAHGLLCLFIISNRPNGTVTQTFLLTNTTSIARQNSSRCNKITNYDIFVEWGEPLTNGLRRQRFTSFLNSVPNALLWDISLPDHSKNTFSARLSTASVELFLTNKQFLDTLEKNNILPFSSGVFLPLA